MRDPNEVTAIAVAQEAEEEETDDAVDGTKKSNGSNGSGKLPTGKFGLRQKAKVGPSE